MRLCRHRLTVMGRRGDLGASLAPEVGPMRLLGRRRAPSPQDHVAEGGRATACGRTSASYNSARR